MSISGSYIEFRIPCSTWCVYIYEYGGRAISIAGAGIRLEECIWAVDPPIHLLHHLEQGGSLAQDVGDLET